jgi:hypothetical protein
MNTHQTTRFGARVIHSRRSGLLSLIGLMFGILSISGCSGTAEVGVQVTAQAAILHWNPSTSAVIGYRVYRSTQSGADYTLITPTPVMGTSFSDTSVSPGQTYYWVVSAVDAQFQESAFSNEVSATIPL